MVNLIRMARIINNQNSIQHEPIITIYNEPVTMANNPMLLTDQDYGIYFSQTKETLLDSEIYLRFIRSAENRFRRSKFYRDYKCGIMNRGLNMDQRRPGITSEVSDIELHHNFLTLEYMAIILTEYTLKHKGCINTFELEMMLEDEHRNNRICGIMLSTTEHQAHHDNPADFISIKQCFGYPFEFIDRYISGMTLDISFKLLLHLKQEEQYGGSYDANMIRVRDEILSWQRNFTY